MGILILIASAVTAVGSSRAPSTTNVSRYCSGSDFDYAVTLSAGSASPLITHVASVADTFTVGFWVTCASGAVVEGLVLLEGYVEGDYTPIAFEPPDWALNAGDPQHLLMAFGGCPSTPALLGTWTFVNDTQAEAGSICLSQPWVDAPSCEIADCCGWWQGPDMDVAGVLGFSVGGAESCSDLQGCESPTSSSEVSWGRIKAGFHAPAN